MMSDQANTVIFEWCARETYSKVDRGKAVENDKDVLVTQFDKAEVKTSCGKRGEVWIYACVT